MNECSSPLKGFKIKYIYPNPKCPKLYLTWIRRHFLKFQSKSRILIYSQFSLFAVVMLYKVAANTEPLLLGEIHRFPRASKSQHLQSQIKHDVSSVPEEKRHRFSGSFLRLWDPVPPPLSPRFSFHHILLQHCPTFIPPSQLTNVLLILPGRR